jgi:hypothetical protein
MRVTSKDNGGDSEEYVKAARASIDGAFVKFLRI